MYQEDILRGKVISISAHIESAISAIILYCYFPDGRDELLQFKGVMIGEKIKMAKQALDERYPEVFKKSKAIFRRYKKIMPFRNQIAHCKLNELNAETGDFSVWDIAEDKKDGDYFYSLKISKIEFDEKVERLELLLQEFEGVISQVFKKMSPILQRLIIQGHLPPG
jgi:hypothetical protein